MILLQIINQKHLLCNYIHEDPRYQEYVSFPFNEVYINNRHPERVYIWAFVAVCNVWVTTYLQCGENA